MAKAPTLRAFLAQQLCKQFDGDAWHGRSLQEILEGITAVQASQRTDQAHSTWEIVLHLTAWIREVTHRLEGHEAREPEEGDWPAVRGESAAAWAAARRRLREAHEEVLEAFDRVPDARLHTPIRDFRYAADGLGSTVAETVSGLIQHDVYHAGQIALLRKLVERT